MYRTKGDRDPKNVSKFVEVAVDREIVSDEWYSIGFDVTHAVKSSNDRIAIVFRGLELRKNVHSRLGVTLKF